MIPSDQEVRDCIDRATEKAIKALFLRLGFLFVFFLIIWFLGDLYEDEKRKNIGRVDLAILIIGMGYLGVVCIRLRKALSFEETKKNIIFDFLKNNNFDPTTKEEHDWCRKYQEHIESIYNPHKFS